MKLVAASSMGEGKGHTRHSWLFHPRSGNKTYKLLFVWRATNKIRGDIKGEGISHCDGSLRCKCANGGYGMCRFARRLIARECILSIQACSHRGLMKVFLAVAIRRWEYQHQANAWSQALRCNRAHLSMIPGEEIGQL